jgi:hypothetical protein
MSSARVDLDALRARVSIRDVLAAAGYDVPTRSGRTCCPLHGGQNATAFAVNERRYHCFGCGAGGDAFELVQQLYRCDFRAAVAHVALLAGVEVGTLPRLDRAAIDRRVTVSHRRAALRAWREQRWTECVITAERFDRDANRLGAGLSRAHGVEDDAREDVAWALLARTCHTRDDSDWLAAQLSEPSELAWLRLWRAQREKACAA